MKISELKTKAFNYGKIKVVIGNTPPLWQDVRNIRKRVFCDEERFGVDMVETDLDSYCVHIALYKEELPVAAASLIPAEYAEPKAREVGVPAKYLGLAACATKLAVLPQERGNHYSILMLALMYHHVLFPCRIRHIFLVLDGAHCKNEHLYQEGGAFRTIKEGKGSYGRRILMLLDTQSEEAKRVIRRFEKMR